MKLRVLALALLLTGCGGGGGTSTPANDDANTINVTQLLNGPSLGAATSYWQCNTLLNDQFESLVFQAFTDNTGRSSAVGDFTWEAVENEVELTIGSNLSIVFDIAHDVTRDRSTFKEFLGVGQIREYSCQRQAF